MTGWLTVFIIPFLILMIYLDRKKILQYNKMPIFLMYLYISPMLIAGSVILTTVFMAVMGMAALPILLPLYTLTLVFLIYILVRICKNPIDKKAVKGSYDAACLKRLTFYRRVSLIPATIIMLVTIIMVIRGVAELTFMYVFSMINPLMWFLFIITMGVMYMALLLAIFWGAVGLLYIAVFNTSIVVWLYLLYLVFSYVLLFRIYRLREMRRSRFLLMMLALYVFPVNFFISPILTKMAKRAAASCEEKYRQQQTQNISKETAKINAGAAIWEDTKPNKANEAVE